MKKFYSFLMAAAVTVSASALDLNKVEGRTIHQPNHKLSTPTNVVSVKKLDAPKVSTKSELSIYDLEGNWEWMFYDMLEDDILTFDCTFTVMDEDVLLIENFIAEGLYGAAIFDAETGDLYIPSMDIMDFGMQDDVQLTAKFTSFYYSFTEDGDLESMYADPDTPLQLFYDADEGAYYNLDAIYGVVVAYDKIVSQDMDDWMLLFNQAYIVPVEPEAADLVEDPADYEDAGLVLFTDGWLYPGFGIEPAEYPYVVSCEKNIYEEGVYRLVDPYSAESGHMAGSRNRATEPGYIRFNIADTRMPYFYPNVKSGYADANMGDFYFYDAIGYIIEVKGEPANYYYLSTQYREKYFSTYNEETETILVNAPWFGYSYGDKNGGYTWIDAYQKPIESQSVLKLNHKMSGIIDINTPSVDGNVEFYNLQGVRVADNFRGICIMRQGNDYMKVIR